MLRRVITTGALVALFATGLSGPANASEDPQASSISNVVLVHGAFADGSGWRAVYDDLTSRGYKVTIVQNPLTSLADDVSATRRVLDRQDGATILVGHSWGGTVITEAGVHPRVAGLVYVSALSPDAGETTAQQYAGYKTPPEFVIKTTADGFGYIDPGAFRVAFAADASREDADFLRDSQVPIAMAAFDAKLTHAAWHTRPSWAIIPTQDKAFDQRMLHAMAERIGASVEEIEASHAVFATQPHAVADVIDRAAHQAAIARD